MCLRAAGCDRLWGTHMNPAPRAWPSAMCTQRDTPGHPPHRQHTGAWRAHSGPHVYPHMGRVCSVPLGYLGPRGCVRGSPRLATGRPCQILRTLPGGETPEEAPFCPHSRLPVGLCPGGWGAALSPVRPVLHQSMQAGHPSSALNPESGGLLLAEDLNIPLTTRGAPGVHPVLVQLHPARASVFTLPAGRGGPSTDRGSHCQAVLQASPRPAPLLPSPRQPPSGQGTPCPRTFPPWLACLVTMLRNTAHPPVLMCPPFILPVAGKQQPRGEPAAGSSPAI